MSQKIKKIYIYFLTLSSCALASLGENAHLRQTHSTLLGRHVAAARADLWQLCYVVLTVLFCLAL